LQRPHHHRTAAVVVVTVAWRIVATTDHVDSGRVVVAAVAAGTTTTTSRIALSSYATTSRMDLEAEYPRREGPCRHDGYELFVGHEEDMGEGAAEEGSIDVSLGRAAVVKVTTLGAEELV
jgi:hypothetical protein